MIINNPSHKESFCRKMGVIHSLLQGVVVYSKFEFFNVYQCNNQHKNIYVLFFPVYKTPCPIQIQNKAI